MRLRNKERAGGRESSPPPARHGDWGCATGWWLPLQPHSSFPDHSESISTLARSFCFLFPPTLFLGPAGISCAGLSHPPPVPPGLSYQGCLQGGPDTRDSPGRDSGSPGNRFGPSRWPTAANSHLVPPTQHQTSCFIE